MSNLSSYSSSVWPEWESNMCLIWWKRRNNWLSPAKTPDLCLKNLFFKYQLMEQLSPQTNSWRPLVGSASHWLTTDFVWSLMEGERAEKGLNIRFNSRDLLFGHSTSTQLSVSAGEDSASACQPRSVETGQMTHKHCEKTARKQVWWMMIAGQNVSAEGK